MASRKGVFYSNLVLCNGYRVKEEPERVGKLEWKPSLLLLACLGLAQATWVATPWALHLSLAHWQPVSCPQVVIAMESTPQWSAASLQLQLHSSAHVPPTMPRDGFEFRTWPLPPVFFLPQQFIWRPDGKKSGGELNSQYKTYPSHRTQLISSSVWTSLPPNHSRI